MLNALEIQYLLGLYFLIASISFGGKLAVDAAKFILGLILLFMTAQGITLM